MSLPPKPSVILSILPKNLKPGVTILFVGGHKETVTHASKELIDPPDTWRVRTDLHPDGILAKDDTHITIEG